uniref:Thioredoxin domain-containing protein n=1 Tax=Prymnesium polylepis TaxID=72548 RepID=A0A7S4MIV8_9EUKA|mmetsp:Transcript_29471/g.72417  ORF Transcript_29471/g.72417 Transcript_29471/m.72417 type:complete len:129 (+) Transcript_29471:22-408(+)
MLWWDLDMLRLRGGGGKVPMIADKAAWDALHKKAGSKLVVVDFTAVWCGPCVRISPMFESMAEKHWKEGDAEPEVYFVKVDVDENEEVAAECEISAMPTFQFYKDGKMIEQIVGADQAKLKANVAKLK